MVSAAALQVQYFQTTDSVEYTDLQKNAVVEPAEQESIQSAAAAVVQATD
jgi:hypothetical protein